MSAAKEQLFQYAVWYRDPEDHAKDELIGEVQTVKAIDRSHVERIAIRALPAEGGWDAKLANIQVDIHPF